tara:strand:+ start:518 stop:913 length:396 start_codon:yes stop_codon:yes gene_type:complete
MVKIISFKKNTNYRIQGGVVNISWKVTGSALSYLRIGKSMFRIPDTGDLDISLISKSFTVRIIVIGFFAFYIRKIEVSNSAESILTGEKASLAKHKLALKSINSLPLSMKTDLVKSINNLRLKVITSPNQD